MNHNFETNAAYFTQQTIDALMYNRKLYTIEELERNLNVGARIPLRIVVVTPEELMAMKKKECIV